LNKTLTTTFLAIAAASAALSSSYCQASDVAASTKVSYADLNLANNEDVHTLYRRLSRAADQVCPNDSVKAHQGCVREAMGAAVQGANLASLSTLYTKITGVRIAQLSYSATVLAQAVRPR